MQRIDVSVTVPIESLGGQVFQVFSDGASGVMDWDAPLNAAPLPLHPGRDWHRGHLLQPHLAAEHLETGLRGGHLNERHLVDAHLVPPTRVTWRTAPLYFGRYKLGLRVQDWAGNVSENLPTPAALTINTGPDAPVGFEKESYDGELDQITFSIEPPLQLVN